MSARLSRVLLVVALLIAQQTALAHQIWHFSPGEHNDTTIASQGGDPQGGKAKGERLCDLHTALGTVLGALSGYAAIAQFQDPAHSIFVVADSPAVVVPAPPPASRGPPASL